MQTRKTARRAVRASRLNSRIKGTSPLIYASVEAKFDAKALAGNTVQCSCQDCNFKFTTVASLSGQKIQPVCANCGSTKVSAKKTESVNVAAIDEATLAAVQCPNKKCGTFQIQSASLAQHLASGYHCVLCGEEQVLTEGEEDETAGADEPDEDDLSLEDDDSVELDSVASETAHGEGNNDTTPVNVPENAPATSDLTTVDPAAGVTSPIVAETPADAGTTPATNVDSGTPPATTVPASVAPVATAAPAAPAAPAPAVATAEPAPAPAVAATPAAPAPAATATTTPAAPAATPTVAEVTESDDLDSFGVGDDDLDDLDTTFPGATDVSGVEDEGEGDDAEFDDVNFSDTAELDATEDGDDLQFEMLPAEDADDAEMSFVYVGDKLTAYVNDLHVATLHKEQAGKNADLFNTDVLVRSVVAQCRESGIRKGLVSAGFKLVRVSIPVQAFVNRKVKEALAKVKEKETASTVATAKDWEQSIAIAMAGLNKNFFAGKDHPLKSGLVTELSALGLRNPGKLVDKVFAAYGGKYNASILALASEMQGKPEEIRSQLAETLDGTNYMPTTATTVEAADDSESDETDSGCDTDDDTTASTSVTARLNGYGHKIIKSDRQTEVSSTGNRRQGSTIASLVEKSGGSLFSPSR